MKPITILTGDCRTTLQSLLEKSVQCCVTSPPYFGLRDYGHAEQIGLEDTPAKFVETMVAVFREVRRVLADDGTLWLNLGDSYTRAQNTNVPQSKNPRVSFPEHTKNGSSDGLVGRSERPGTRAITSLAPKNLLGIPWRVAFALQSDGWILRQDIIWHKPNPMPESVTDRCTKAHEYIFLFSKSERYYFDSQAMQEPAKYAGLKGQDASGFKNAADFNGKHASNPEVRNECGGRGGKNAFRDQGHFRDTETGPANRKGRDMCDIGASGTRNKRDVWTVATKPYKGAHFATFPPDLIEPCVLAGCPIGGTVLDPFGGAGTTGLVAQKHGRNAVLCELNEKYVDLIEQRLGLKQTEDWT